MFRELHVVSSDVSQDVLATQHLCNNSVKFCNEMPKRCKLAEFLSKKEKRSLKSMRFSLERLVEADGGSTVEDYVDAGTELLHILWADGQARLRQLAADGNDLLVEVGVVLPHTVEQLPETQQKNKET